MSQLETSISLLAVSLFLLNQLLPLLEDTCTPPTSGSSPEPALPWQDGSQTLQLFCGLCSNFHVRNSALTGKQGYVGGCGVWRLKEKISGGKLKQEKQLCDLTVVNQSLCKPACSFELDTPITSSKLFSFWQSLFSK